MSGGMTATSMTAAHVAVALVAACKLTGVDPEGVFRNGEGGGNTRVLAAATCVARLGWPKRDAARVFHIHPNRLTPSGLTIAKVRTDQMLSVAEALREHGLLADDPGGPPSNPRPAAEAATPRHKTDPAAKGPGTARPAPDAAPARAKAADAARANPVRREGPRPKAVPRSKGGRVVQLKPVNRRIVRWTRQQLNLGADLDFIADCFDVDRAELAAALDPMAVAA